MIILAHTKDCGYRPLPKRMVNRVITTAKAPGIVCRDRTSKTAASLQWLFVQPGIHSNGNEGPFLLFRTRIRSLISSAVAQLIRTQLPDRFGNMLAIEMRIQFAFLFFFQLWLWYRFSSASRTNPFPWAWDIGYPPTMEGCNIIVLAFLVWWDLSRSERAAVGSSRGGRIAPAAQ